MPPDEFRGDRGAVEVITDGLFVTLSALSEGKTLRRTFNGDRDAEEEVVGVCPG